MASLSDTLLPPWQRVLQDHPNCRCVTVQFDSNRFDLHDGELVSARLHRRQAATKLHRRR